MKNRYAGLSSLWATARYDEEEFEESDVWESVYGPDKTSFPVPIKASVVTRRIQAATEICIPKPGKNKNSSATRYEQQQSSAPVAVPDWSKIYGGRGAFGGGSWESEDEEDESEGNLIPPHEWIARKRTSSFSVCEGVGRTLKGRDLSRVRNAVLTRTGFLESD
ncbi:Protein of unknown function- DUF584 [Striga hermonthica]|uniref:Senescence regulator n=1 Tax=Striga hermonthica TaxID=68872 RepID=A0A9N7NMG1_STRHE|nr:Protein of unknown function- DUF584 [Striga hermonthica]